MARNCRPRRGVADGTGAHAASVAITSPSDGASVSGSVSINTSIGSSTVWIDLYVDGHYFASGPPSSFTWNRPLCSDGGHTISAKAFIAPGNGHREFRREYKCVEQRRRSQSGFTNGYYFLDQRIDSNPCTQGSPCQSLGRAQQLIRWRRPRRRNSLPARRHLVRRNHDASLC